MRHVGPRFIVGPRGEVGGGWALVGARCRAALMLLLALMLTFFLLPIPIAHASNNGRIFGQLLDGTKNNAPIVGQSVTLQMAQGNTARDLTSVKTDAHGSFAFNSLAPDKTLNYALYTRYQGAQYYTDLIDLSSKPSQQINLTVYDATSSSSKIAIVQATLLFHQPDAQTGVLSISEVFFFKNIGTYTYVGSLDASKGKPNALLFPLPPGARNVSLSKGFDGYQAIQIDRGFASDAALPPGTSQFVFSFELPYTTANYTFSYQIMYPTVQLSLLVPPDLNANSNTFTSAGLITADQHPYRLFQAKDLLAGTLLQAQLQGLPVTQPSTGSLNQSSLWLIVGILLMLAILAVTWFLLRSTRRPRHGDPRGRPQLARARPGDQLHNQRQTLLQELLNLDKAYEAGKLKKSLYQERRAKTKARLRTLMAENASSTVKKTAKSGGKEVS